MRFFITSNIKGSPPLRTAVLLFLFCSLLYWLGNWLFYHFKFGLTYERMFTYFFMDPEFPERLPPAQLFEDVHIQLFLMMIFLIVLTPIFLHSRADRFARLLVVSAFTAGTGEVLSSLGVYFLGPVFIYPKIALFLILQLSSGLMLLFSLRLYLTGEKEVPPERSMLYLVVLFLALSTVLFTVIGFFLFVAKMGITPQSVSEYYLGNPERFMKPKSLPTLMKVVSPHLLAMGVYVLALTHLAFFTNLRKKVLWTLSLFSLALAENLSGPLIRYVWEGFSYLKIFSFLGLSAGMVYLSMVVVLSVLRHRARGTVVL